MSKFTPGPWVSDFTFRDGIWIDPHVAHVYLCEYTNEETVKANARLILAAPTLFEIAKAYRNLLKTMAHTEGEVATFHHIESVIAKIEGDLC